MKQKITCLLFVLTLFVFKVSYAEGPSDFGIPTGPGSSGSFEACSFSECSEVIQYAQENLPLYGQLLINSSGFVYLKVDDQYIHALFPLIRCEGCENFLVECGCEGERFEKPPYFESENAFGAHISVFDSNGHVQPEEIGQIFSFELEGRALLHFSSKTNVFSYMLRIKCTELETLPGSFD